MDLDGNSAHLLIPAYGEALVKLIHSQDLVYM